jgi:hypothetical protein
MRSSARLNAVRNDLEELAGEVDRAAVCEVAAVGQVHRQDRVAGLELREVDRHVRLRAGMRLDIDVIGAEKLLRAADGEVLDDVDELAAAVVAPAWIALGVFIGHHRSLRFEDGFADGVFRGDKLEVLFEALGLL